MHLLLPEVFGSGAESRGQKQCMAVWGFPGLWGQRAGGVWYVSCQGEKLAETGPLPRSRAGLVLPFTPRGGVMSCGQWNYSSFIYLFLLMAVL